MNCSLDLLNTFLPGTTEGGKWELLGFSLTPSGTYGPGGNWPWNTNSTDHVIVNFNNLQQGYYKLNYFVVGNCGGLQEIIIPVVGGGSAGISKSITLCTTDPKINLFNELGASFDSGILEPIFSYSGNGVGTNAYSSENSNTPIDDTFDPSLIGPGSYQITLNIEPKISNPYTLSNCDNCLPSTATLFITVEQITSQISLNDCIIDFVTNPNCGSFVLHKDTGSGYSPTNITSLPYTVTENASWKLVYSNCNCLLESNEVISEDCCISGTVTIGGSNVGPCYVRVISISGCTETSKLWEESQDGGQTWNPIPSQSSIIIASGNYQYRCTLFCSNGCKAISNIYTVSGCSGCNNSINTQAGNCELTAVSGSNCTDGTIYLFRENSPGIFGSIDSYSLGTYPHTFNISQNGTYKLGLYCPGCGYVYSNEYVFNSCETPPSCNSSVTLSVSGCNLTAIATNCPNANFVFKDPLGNIVQQGTSNTYIANQNGIWSVEVSNCPNCGLLSDSVNVNCIVNCNCSTSITLNNCILNSNDIDCVGYSAVWRWFDSQANSWIIKGSGNSIVPDENGLWERRLTKNGCPTVSDQISVNCVGSGCSLTIDNYSVDSNDCSKVNFSYSGAISSNVSIQFSYPQVNPTDCNNAGGWSTFNPLGTWSFNTNGTGGGYFTAQSPYINKCIRLIIIDNDNPNCPPVVDYLFVPECCIENPTINESTQLNTYSIKVFDNLGNEDNCDIELINNSSDIRVTGIYKIYKNGVEIFSSPYDNLLNASFRTGGQTDNLVTGDTIIQVQMDLNSGSTISIPTSPTTAMLSGSAGTVLSSDLIYNASNGSIMANALQIVILNYLDAQGYTINGLLIQSPGSRITLLSATLHNPTNPNFIGFKNGQSVGTYSNNGQNKTIPQNQHNNYQVNVIINYDIICPTDLVYSKESSSIFNIANSDFNQYVLKNPNSEPLININQDHNFSESCTVTTLTADNLCTGSNLLWSTGETSISIDVISGTYSLEVTCPDGCIYNITITI